MGFVLAEDNGTDSSQDDTANSDDSAEDDEVNVDIDIDVIYDEENTTDNISDDSSHTISLKHHVTANPIFLVLIASLIFVLPLRRD